MPGDGGPGEAARLPLIIYASRTHSQLSQVASELRKTTYRPRVGLIGSRDQLCSNPSVASLTSNGAKTTVCRRLVESAACDQYNRVEGTMRRLGDLQEGNLLADAKAPIFDIEDIVSLAKRHRACPFFLSRQGLADADLVIMPYNYLVDSKSAGTIAGLSRANAVVIFDEAHNVEGSCSEAASAEFTTEDLRGCLRELKECAATLAGSPSEDAAAIIAAAAPAASLEKFIRSLVELIEAMPLRQDGTLAAGGEYIFDLLAKAGADCNTVQQLVIAIEGLAKDVIEGTYFRTRKSPPCHLQKMESCLRTIFRPVTDEAVSDAHELSVRAAVAAREDARYFRTFIEAPKDDAGAPSSMARGRLVSYWCFNPGVAMRELAASGVRSIILTSGTLSPLSSFSLELQLYVPSVELGCSRGRPCTHLCTHLCTQRLTRAHTRGAV